MHIITRNVSRRAALVLLAFAITAFAGAQAAGAQAPPNPPARFVGSVTVNGQPASAGTTVEARIGSTTCGTGAVFMSGAEARYVVDSPDVSAAANCGTDGATVSFVVGGVAAGQTGVWHSYQLNTVNLTAGGAAAATATATAAPRTPAPPTTGSGVEPGGVGSSGILFLAVGFLGTLAGAAVIWRSLAPSRA